jgi:putative tricarboxylic transport membrane protein
MIMHGLRPGPLLFQENPEVVWGLIASMYLGNVMLLILNLPLISLWVSIMRLPTHIILTAVFALSVIGAFAEDGTWSDLWVLLAFGIAGYFMEKLDFPRAPVVLALVLTSRLEGALTRSLVISSGDWSIFFVRPIALVFMIIALLSILVQTPLFASLRKRIIPGPVEEMA